jgi:VIT1/CCC1 family predicted Fe2+/Mn2+ transporter
MAFTVSIAGTLAALFLLGIGVSRLTHRHPLAAGLRQAGMGFVAAAVTYGVGTLLGTAVR